MSRIAVTTATHKMRSEPSHSAFIDERAVGPVIGVVLLVSITVLLAGVGAAFVFGLTEEEEEAPAAAIEVEAIGPTDEVTIVHKGGGHLDAQHMRIVWEIENTEYKTSPTESKNLLKAGDQATFTFDGTTAAVGKWANFPSPGSQDIESGDEVTVKIYDQRSNKPVVKKTVSAISEQGSAAGHSGELIWPHDHTSGKNNVRYEMHFTIESGSNTIGNSLNSVEIVMDDSSLNLFSGTSQSDVATVGVDEDGDGSIEKSVKSDIDQWNVKSGGSHLKIGFSGSVYTNPKAGETIILQLDAVDNPSTAGDYGVEVQTSGDGNWQTGTVEINN